MRKRKPVGVEASRADKEPTWIERHEVAKILGKAVACAGFLNKRVKAGRVRAKHAPLGKAYMRHLYAREDVEAIKAEYRPRGPRKGGKKPPAALVKRGRKSEIEKINAALEEVNVSNAFAGLDAALGINRLAMRIGSADVELTVGTSRVKMRLNNVEIGGAK